MSRSRTNANLVATAERRAFVVELRKSGATYQQIARQTVIKFGVGSLPKGYDERQACQDVSRELERLRLVTAEAAENVIAMELERLDAMLFGLWMEAKRGDVQSVDRVLKIMERRAKLIGLDEPDRFIVDWRKEAEEKGLDVTGEYQRLVERFAATLQEGNGEDVSGGVAGS